MIATAIGPIVDRILEYAARNRIDVIVMGTHRRGFVGRRLFGSVADRVVQRSPVPVVRVHRGAQPVRIRRRPRMHASRAR
jgi:nucleotide-binding universal stress UspA family protein